MIRFIPRTHEFHGHPGREGLPPARPMQARESARVTTPVERASPGLLHHRGWVQAWRDIAPEYRRDITWFAISAVLVLAQVPFWAAVMP